jgi:hypothetical protein
MVLGAQPQKAGGYVKVPTAAGGLLRARGVVYLVHGTDPLLVHIEHIHAIADLTREILSHR